jgi:hypothetical protein
MAKHNSEINPGFKSNAVGAVTHVSPSVDRLLIGWAWFGFNQPPEAASAVGAVKPQRIDMDQYRFDQFSYNLIQRRIWKCAGCTE